MKRKKREFMNELMVLFYPTNIYFSLAAPAMCSKSVEQTPIVFYTIPAIIGISRIKTSSTRDFIKLDTSLWYDDSYAHISKDHKENLTSSFGRTLMNKAVNPLWIQQTVFFQPPGTWAIQLQIGFWRFYQISKNPQYFPWIHETI